jgi:small GTP-binding protein
VANKDSMGNSCISGGKPVDDDNGTPPLPLVLPPELLNASDAELVAALRRRVDDAAVAAARLIRGATADIPDVLRFMLLVIGDTGVGKTCLVERFTTGTVSSATASGNAPTIGTDFVIKEVDVGGTRVKLHITDTSGAERFAPMVAASFQNKDAVVLCFDATIPASLEPLLSRFAPLLKAARAKGFCLGGVVVATNTQEFNTAAVREHCAPILAAHGQPFDVGGNMPFVETCVLDTASGSGGGGAGVDDAFHAALMSAVRGQLAALHRQELGGGKAAHWNAK